MKDMIMNVIAVLLLIFLLVVAAIIVVSIVCKIIVALYRKIALRYEEVRDVATVTDKIYDENTLVQIATKTYPLGIYAKYEVHIMCDGQEFCFDDRSLYEKFEVGDYVMVLVHNGYNRWNGELKHTYLEVEK